MSIAVKLILSGICVLVPGDDAKPSRITCPNATAGTISSAGAPIPPHYPYLIIDEASLADPKQALTSTFRMGPGGRQLVWILDSASIALKEMPPAGAKRSALSEAADLTRIWPDRGKIKPEFWDVSRHPDKISMRLDLPSGELSTGAPNPVTWEYQPKQTAQPVVQRSAQEIIARVELPSATLQIRNYGGAAKYEQLEIALKSPNDGPVDVSIGNAPLNDVLLLPHSSHQHHAQMHDFELFYRMFNAPPRRPPIPLAKDVTGKARFGGLGGTCIPAICTGC